MVVEVCWTQLQFSQHGQDWLYGSLLMIRTAHIGITLIWNGASHARCAIVEPTATMRVQNYAGSRIKRGSCAKCSPGWHAICLLYSYNSIGQHFNWYRASRRSLGDCWAFCYRYDAMPSRYMLVPYVRPSVLQLSVGILSKWQYVLSGKQCHKHGRQIKKFKGVDGLL